MEPQLSLFVTVPETAPRPRRERGLSRSERMARRLDDAAAQHERDAETCRLCGDAFGERRAREQARDASRAAQILRAGPEGVAAIMAA